MTPTENSNGSQTNPNHGRNRPGKVRVILFLVILTVVVGWLFRPTSNPQVIEDTRQEDEEVYSSETMKKVRFQKFGEEDMPYEIYAPEGEQRWGSEDTVNLLRPEAKFRLKNEDVIEVRSERGVYNLTEESLFLEDEVVLINSRDIRLESSELWIFVNNDIVLSHEPVRISGDSWKMESLGFQANIARDNILFAGPVRMEFDHDFPILDIWK